MKGTFELITVFFVLAAIGTAYSNRDKTEDVRRERWLKFIVHLFIVYGLLGVMMYATAYFRWVALVIIVLGAWELLKVRREGIATGQSAGLVFYLLSFLLYGLIGVGFFGMASGSDTDFSLLIFVLVFTFDGFSQVFGQLFGKRQLFPVTSPNKTVEGLCGGLGMVLLVIVFEVWPTSFNEMDSFIWRLLMFIPVGLFIVAGALAGDWLASFYKRRHGVKDFSGLIPGHGGILDRFDSWLVAGALAWGVLYLFSSL